MLSIFTDIVGGVRDFFKNRHEISKAKQELKLAGINNKTRLMMSDKECNHSWEMASLEDKDKSLRRISYAMFALPFFVAVFFPMHVNVYFEKSIATVPVWWQKIFVIINASVWGISSLKDYGPPIANFIKKILKRNE